MKKCIVRAMGIVLTAGLVITSVAVQKNVVSADAVTGTSKYIAFGADLNAKERRRYSTDLELPKVICQIIRR